MPSTRRHFLRSTAATAAGFTGLHQFLSPQRTWGHERQVALTSDPAGLLDLPAGFSYQVISRAGDEMDDGLLVPGLPDGMATFNGPGGLAIIIRNHEQTPDQEHGPFGRNLERLNRVDPTRIYDLGDGKLPGIGGTTTIVYDTDNQKIVRQFLSLAGTCRNCAGGPTPWNTWISCEENVDKFGHNPNGYFSAKDHGYNFEVQASHVPGLAAPLPLYDMGRFYHEAIAIDAGSGIAYETEDREDGLIYRFLPHRQEQFAAGGRLQVLSIVGACSADTRNWEATFCEPGASFSVEWLDIGNVKSPDDDLRYRGFDQGAARFARAEGMWAGNHEVFFACTNGGNARAGQIWRYRPSRFEGQPGERREPGRLELFIEPNDSNLLQSADNLTVSPWGDLVVCEDRPGDVVRLVGVTPSGHCYTLAHSHAQTEFAGATFSRDGSTLFVNMQGEHSTLAITGRWSELLATT